MSKVTVTESSSTGLLHRNKMFLIYTAILTFTFLVIYNKIYDSKLFIGGDNATYYLLGKGIADGKGYVNIERVSEKPANHFPPGYPAIVAAIMKITGQDIDHVKIANGIFLLISILLLFYLFTMISGSINLAFVCSFLLLFNFHLLQYSTWMMSEISFLLFSTLTLIFFLNASKNKDKLLDQNLLLIILCLVVTYYIRTVGLALLGALLVTFLIEKEWKRLGVTVVGFVLLALPWYIRGKNLGGNSYMNQLAMKNPYRPEEGMMVGSDWWERFTTNFERYLSTLIPNGIFGVNETPANDDIQSSAWLVGIIILALVIFGIKKLKSHGFLIFAYLGASFFILCLWPSVWYDFRFMVPLIPLLFFLFSNGLFELLKMGLEKMKIQSDAKWFSYVPFGLLLLVPNYSDGIGYLGKSAHEKFPAAYRNYFALAEWCKKNAAEDAVVCCRKGNLFYLFSDRKTAGYKNTTDPEELVSKLEELGVDYVLIDQLGFSSTQRYLVPAVQKYPEKFQLIQQLKNPDTYLLKCNFDPTKEKTTAEEDIEE